jgi:hypothetical protein
VIPTHEGCCSAWAQKTTHNRRKKSAKCIRFDCIYGGRVRGGSAGLPNVDVSFFGCGGVF